MRGSVWASFRAGSEGPRISYNDSTTIYDSDYNRGKGKEIPVRDFRDYKYEGSRYDDLLMEFGEAVLVQNGKAKILKKYSNFKLLLLDEWLLDDIPDDEKHFLLFLVYNSYFY